MLLADSVVTLILVWVDSTMGSWYCTGAIRPTLYSRGTLGVVGVFGCSVVDSPQVCVLVYSVFVCYCASLECVVNLVLRPLTPQFSVSMLSIFYRGPYNPILRPLDAIHI